MSCLSPVDLPFWPIADTDVQTSLDLLLEIDQLHQQLALLNARHDEDLSALAAAARALHNGTPVREPNRGTATSSSVLQAVLAPDAPPSAAYERARRHMLELGDHVVELWQRAQAGARAVGELDSAAALQRGWLPDEGPARISGVEVAGCCRAANDCCGDWWQCTRLSDERVLVLVLDAMGSGPRAALLIALLKGALDIAVRYATRSGLTLAGLLAAFNRTVYRAARGAATVTCTAAIIDVAARTMAYAGAGHPLPMCARAGREVRCLPARGSVLGASAHQRYRESVTALQPGDAVVWCTDGVLECENPRGRRFGARRLCEAIEAAPSRSPDLLRAALCRRLARFAGQSARNDDLTLVVAGIPTAV